MSRRVKGPERWLSHYNSAQPRVPLQAPRVKRDEPFTIPEGIARLAYEEYAHRFGTDQSFERLHERGGFGTVECLALLADLIERERVRVSDNTQDPADPQKRTR